MRNRFSMALGALVLLAGAVAVRADWNPGDPYKMHYPQLPEPNGIDIKASYPKILADDWRCTETGPVSDIHIWGSWFNDQKYPGAFIHVSIHSDVPANPSNPYSQPGELLWSRDFAPGEYLQRIYGPPNPQTWWDPKLPYDPIPNHVNTWQYNMVDIPQPFIQNVGQIYWLDISFFGGYDATGNIIPLPPDFMFGWKTSASPHFMDDAVWMHLEDPPPPMWHPLDDPRVPPGTPPVSLDLAFVITPEPSALVLLCAGSLILLRRR